MPEEKISEIQGEEDTRFGSHFDATLQVSDKNSLPAAAGAKSYLRFSKPNIS